MTVPAHPPTGPIHAPTPRLVLHIGAGKSGSSAIQAALKLNASALRGRGFLVPDISLGVSGLVEGRQVRFFEATRAMGTSGSGVLAARLDGLRQAMARDGLHTVLVSAENLVNASSMAAMLNEASTGFQASAIAYVRRQDEYLAAAWAQWACKVNRAPFDAWVAAQAGRAANWETTVSRWEREAPNIPLTVRVFERDRLVGRDVVRDYLSLLGNDLRDLPPPADPMNVSLNELGACICWKNQRMFKGAHDSRFSDFVRALGKDLVLRPVSALPRWSAPDRRALMRRYEASNERLRMRRFPALPPGSLFLPVADDVRPRLEPDDMVRCEAQLLSDALGVRVPIDEVARMWPVAFARHLARGRPDAGDEPVPQAPHDRAGVVRPIAALKRWLLRPGSEPPAM